MTTVQIASDLHIEFNENSDSPNPLKYITPVADILILAGDIGSLYRIQQLTFFLKQLSIHFKVVLYIPGNHEWYCLQNYENIPLTVLKDRFENLQKIITNLYILDRSSVRIENICIAGVTLWSDPKCKIPPFRVKIEELNTIEYKKRHTLDLEYIKKMIKYCNKNNYKLIVVTHHSPSMKIVEEKKKFKSLYATDLEYLLNKNDIHTWICGHIHKNFDFITDNGTRIVGNQKGKPKDRINDYNTKFIIKF